MAESSQVEIPTILTIDITQQVYNSLKQNVFRELTPLARGYVEDYFTWLGTLTPRSVIDAIETGQSLKQKYDDAPLSNRIPIAMARALIKASPRLKIHLSNSLSPRLVKYTIKFENPEVWTVIQMYGEQGESFLKDCIRDSREIFGLTS